MSAPREITYDASGMTFAALAWGDEADPLVVCLHGYPDTAWTWRHLGPHLAERGRRVVAPFLRGYAPSGFAPDGGYEVGALARDAVEAHRALGGDERAVLIGHDWGAEAAYAAASHSPGLYARVVTMAVPPSLALLVPRQAAANPALALRQLRCSWYMLFQQLPEIPERVLPRLIRRLWADWSPGYDATEDLRHVADALSPPGRRTAALDYYRALLRPGYLRAAYAPERRHTMGVPSVPTLYLHGRDDGCILVEIGERARDILPAGSRVEIVNGAGHFVQLEAPDVVNPLVAEFLGVPGPPGSGAG